MKIHKYSTPNKKIVYILLKNNVTYGRCKMFLEIAEICPSIINIHEIKRLWKTELINMHVFYSIPPLQTVSDLGQTILKKLDPMMKEKKREEVKLKLERLILRES